MANFTVANGKIIGPNGQPFVALGTAVYDDVDLPSAASAFATTLPGINFVRMTNFTLSEDTVAYLTPYIDKLTSEGIVVEIQDTNYPAVLTGSALTQAEQWYASFATAFKSNPDVWFDTQNEPTGGDVTDDQNEIVGIYNAIRATGNSNIVMMDPGGNTIPGMSESAFATMTNVVWDEHYYNWESGYSTSVATNEAQLSSDIATLHTITSANGTIPVIVGEYGNSTDGSNVDPGATATLQAVQNSVVSGQTQGAVSWEWYNSGTQADNMVNAVTGGTGSLSSYGQEVAQFIASEAKNAGGGGTTGGGGSNPVLITPGSGSFTDASGNVYTLDAAGNADENGKPIPGGGGTEAMEYANGLIYGEDAGGSGWYTWNGTNWNAAAAPPAVTGGGGTTPPPPPPPPTTSPSGTTITSTSAAPIIDKSGNSWSLVQSASRGLQIAVNGVVDAPSANVVLLETLNGAMVQENAAGNWYSETTNNDSWSQLAGNPNAPPPPPVPTFPTATDFFVTPGSGSFTAAGNTYSIDAAGNADQNGTAIPGGGGTSAMAYIPSTVFGQDSASGQWYSLSGSNWTATAPTLVDITSKGNIDQALPRSGTLTENGDTFTLASGNVITASLGAGNDNIGFIAPKQVTLSGGSGTSQVLLVGGTNTVTAGTGSLDVAAGGGADAYTFHAGDGLLTLEDFSLTKGDTLTIDKTLEGAMTTESDGHGGTALVFGANSAIDLKGLTTAPTIHWQ